MFGAKLGLSSMMAAGLGNTVADVVGINISHTIEVRGGNTTCGQLDRAVWPCPRSISAPLQLPALCDAGHTWQALWSRKPA